jgi:hypothetical protein
VRASIPERTRDFYSSQKPIEAYPASNSNDTGAISMGAKRPDREAYHLSSSSTEVKNNWSRISALLVCVFMAETGKILPLSLHVFGNKENIKFFLAGSIGRAV